jgi:aryl-alcohol dehydrogenase-like predicted oxidoreductase
MGPGPNDGGNSRFHIIKSCDDSLRRLQTDHIDLFQLHRPALDIPQDETLRALDDLVRAGKVRYIGCSTFPAWMVMEALATSKEMNLARFVSEQPPYNLLDRRIENELVPLCQRYGLAILPWSPLAGGILAGRYAGGATPEGSRAARNGAGSPFDQRRSEAGIAAAEKVAALAKQRNMTASQLALLWVKDQPAITAPIIGPRTMEHLKDNLAVLEQSLAEEDRTALDAINGPGNALSDFHNSNPWMKTRIGAA